MANIDFSIDFPRLYGDSPCSGLIRQQAEDFIVEEQLGFELLGSGEHAYLQIEKKGENTVWLAKQLARIAGVNIHDVGYAGLKDRHALTTQWFSVWLPGRDDPDWHLLNSDSVNILHVGRHNRKLKRGIHRANAFHLTIRELDCQADIEQRLTQMRRYGVPNYYGEQRFGHGAGNLQQADELLRGSLRVKDRQHRGILLSSARSFLFNQVVAERIHQGCFAGYLEGDRLMLEGSSNLSRESDRGLIDQQLDRLELHPTAPLYGSGRALVEGQSLALEAGVLEGYPQWCEGLERAGLRRERRAVRLALANLRWQLTDPQTLTLSFELPPGCFATSVLRECCRYSVALAATARGES